MQYEEEFYNQDFGVKIPNLLVPKKIRQDENLEIYGIVEKKFREKYNTCFYRTMPCGEATKDIFISLGEVDRNGIDARLAVTQVHSFIYAQSLFYCSAKKVMDQILKCIEKDVKDTGCFMKLLLIFWNAKSKSLELASLGRNYIMHYQAMERKYEIFELGDIALGLKHFAVDIQSKDRKLVLERGDVVIILMGKTIDYLKNNNVNMLVFEQISELINEYAQSPIDRFANQIYYQITNYYKKQLDINITVIRAK